MSERDIAELEHLRSEPERLRALELISGIQVTESKAEARLLHALYLAGMRAVDEQVLDAGYAVIAAEQDERELKAVSRRRRPSWGNE